MLLHGSTWIPCFSSCNLWKFLRLPIPRNGHWQAKSVILNRGGPPLVACRFRFWGTQIPHFRWFANRSTKPQTSATQLAESSICIVTPLEVHGFTRLNQFGNSVFDPDDQLLSGLNQPFILLPGHWMTKFCLVQQPPVLGSWPFS